MARRVALLCGLLLVAGVAFGQLQERLDAADEAYDADNLEEARSTLDGVLSEADSGSEEAEVYWRLSRVTLSIGDRRRDDGAGEDVLLPLFEQGESYADQAIEADPSNHLGYYWKSANIGRWGQVKGILNSLVRATPMRDLLVEAINREPDHADSYYVLSQLYEQVPGMISFGNADYAVSLGRRAMALHEEELASGEEEDFREGYQVKLAAALASRDWSEGKRRREQSDKARAYRRAESELERGFHFEGTVGIPQMSDEEEARELLDEVISDLRRRSDLSEQEERQLREAQELRRSL